MKILYMKLNILSERSGGRDNAKKKCNCISIPFSSKKNGWGK